MRMHRQIGRMAVLLIAILAVVTPSGCEERVSESTRPAQPGTDRYIDCANGSDTNPGTRSAPLRNPTQLRQGILRAGATLWLARGCTWDGQVVIRDSGSATSPVTISSYGTGTAPKLTGKSLTRAQSVLELAGQYLNVSNVEITDAPGTAVEITGQYNSVSNSEISRVGFGVVFKGQNGSATRVDAHDLVMVLNTPGGNDDYGAVGYVVQAPDIEISYSRCTNCRAPSRDFGYDGGFVEIWNYGDRLSVHHNIGQNTQGVLEVGGIASDRSARDVMVRDNDFQDAHGGVWLHGSGTFGMRGVGVTMTENRIVVTSRKDPEVLGGDLGPLTFIHNQVTTPGQISRTGSPRVHACNIFQVKTTGSVGYQPDSTELVVTDPASPANPAESPAGCR